MRAGCDAGGGPYAILGIMLSPWSKIPKVKNAEPWLSELAAHFLDESHCYGARGLSSDAREKLKEIRDGKQQSYFNQYTKFL